MNVGIIGFRGCGKTTVFNALTGLHAEVGGYHGDDVKNLGNIKVPDKRLKAIADIVNPKKLIYAEIIFVDLAATTPAAGKGFSAQALADMRQSDALVHVVRGFDNPSLPNKPDLRRDTEGFESELILADLIVVENRLERMKKQGAKDKEKEYLEAIKAHLEQDLPLRTLDLGEDAWANLAGFGFLSRKICMVLLNVTEDQASAAIEDKLAALIARNQLRAMVVSGQVEMEVNDLDEAEALDYLQSVGLEEPAKYRFIREVYDMLNLMSFFTFGPDEVRSAGRGQDSLGYRAWLHPGGSHALAGCRDLRRQRIQTQGSGQNAPGRQGLSAPGRRVRAFPL
jgi:ribosome-binding ATPase YchF (GTP1/OBG family)